MAAYYPPVGFHFKVEFQGITSASNDHQFQSVSGLSVDLETEEIAEGGENRFKHKIPVRTKYPNLVLKRGLLIDSGLIDWCKKAIEDLEIAPINLTVILLNEKHEPLLTWDVVHAYPVKWAVEDFNAEESKLAIESLELTYNYFKTLN
ncbi:phage tail protein [Aquimarina pacifica]|uniref:phage tail protein n=1 Tax=Aquimarina pacifica TaxID=1296415 RepID=UPI000471367A|nr:phage tail protein [Aquimarina pacifica]